MSKKSLKKNPRSQLARMYRRLYFFSFGVFLSIFGVGALVLSIVNLILETRPTLRIVQYAALIIADFFWSGSLVSRRFSSFLRKNYEAPSLDQRSTGEIVFENEEEDPYNTSRAKKRNK